MKYNNLINLYLCIVILWKIYTRNGPLGFKKLTFGKNDAHKNSKPGNRKNIVQSPGSQAHGGNTFSDAITAVLETYEGGYCNSRGKCSQDASTCKHK